MPNLFKIQNLGKIAVGGFGEQAMQGMLMAMLNDLTEEKAYKYITEDSQLLKRITGQQWQHFGNMARKAKMQPITMETVEKFLSEKRIDLLSVVINTPNGKEWLTKQVNIVNQNLGLIAE
jgi:hypothetical protein